MTDPITARPPTFADGERHKGKNTLFRPFTSTENTMEHTNDLADSERVGIIALCNDLADQGCSARTIEHVREVITSRQVRINQDLSHIRALETRATITVKKSPTADSRTCDFANVSERTLLNSSVQHIADVRRGLAFFGAMLDEAATRHDEDKLTDIEGFHRDFVAGNVLSGEWLAKHYQMNRHHLLTSDGVRDDVNLVDVLDMISDCVMAGMARSGSVYPLNIPDEVLRRAFDNTVKCLQANVRVVNE